MEELIKKVKGYSKTERIERLIKIGVAMGFNQASPMDLVEVELIQAIRKANGEIAQIIKEREENNKMGDNVDNIQLLKTVANILSTNGMLDEKSQHINHDKRYNEPFEDDGAYAD